MTRLPTVTRWCPTLIDFAPPSFPGGPSRQAGISLIEVMVSMVLALITFLIMFQMFEAWDRNKRSTAAGGGAMVNGSIAMFRLERDLRLAGFGFGGGGLLAGCTVAAYDTARVNAAGTAAPDFTFPLVPLQIIDGAAGAPDQLIVLYASSEGIPGTRFFGTAAAGTPPYSVSGADWVTMEIGSLGGIRQGDMVIRAANGANCTPATPEIYMVEATNNITGDRRTFEHKALPIAEALPIAPGTVLATHKYTSYYTGQDTTPRHNAILSPPAAALPTGMVISLGPTPQRRIWQIRNGRTLAYTNDLAFTDQFNNSTGAATPDNLNDFTDIADNVINLQAQYGFAGTLAGTTCTASSPPTWTETSPAAGSCLWNYLWAVRVALLTRSDQYERAVVTTAAPSWAGGSFVMSNLNNDTGASNPTNDWHHYRYKVFEVMVLLKNVMWLQR